MPSKGDFVSVNYTGRISGGSEVFDTTSEEEARKAGIFSEKVAYGPLTVLLGSGHMLAGLEEQVIEMSPGEKRTVSLSPEKAFGPVDSKKVQLLPEKIFSRENTKPSPGMVVNIQGLVGKILSVSSGRVTLDFNHPLAGKTIEYDVEFVKTVTDPKEQFRGILHLHSHKGQDARETVEGDSAEVLLPVLNPMPLEVMEEIAREARAGIPSIKKIKFSYLFE